MVAVVEVDAGQAVKRSKATDEEGKTPPQPQPMRAVRKQRQPTPDHPPYCWMIGEAIDALCENGGSEEDSISAFIRARYPGAPPAHDRLLRHYLDKHVAEGFFVFTAAGRYMRCPEGNTVMELAAGGSSEETCVGFPVAEAKRGRGRPRKDGSSSTSPASKKDGAWSVTPNCRGEQGAAAGLAAYEGSVRMSPVVEHPVQPAAAGSSKSEEVVVARRGRGRPRKDGSSWTSSAGKKDEAVSSTPKRRGRRRAVVPLAAGEDCVPESLVAVADEEGGIQAVSSMPKRRGWLRKLGMANTTESSGKPLVAGKKDDGEVPYIMDKNREPPRELALVIVNDDSATTWIMDKACAEASPTEPPREPVEGDQSHELALVTTTSVPVLAPTPAMGDEDNHGAPSFNLAVVAKNDSICTMPTAPAPESSSQACELALVVADDASVPVLVADKEGIEAAPSATNKRVRQLGKAGSAPTAGKKAGGKDLSATPKGRLLRQRKLAVVAADGSALTPVAGRKKASASPKPIPVTAGGCSTPVSVADLGIKARKLYPVTADEIPDDPGCCLLALPSLTTAANA
ncbi:unnamed protein product [Urochloa humidicola]